MIWIISEEQNHYHTSAQEQLLKKYNKRFIRRFATAQSIREMDCDELAQTLFLAPYAPPAEFVGFIPQVREFSSDGVLTSQERALSISNPAALAKRLGIEVSESTYTLDDIAGASALKAWTRDVIEASKRGYRCKAVLLAGLPGTGKTYFAKAFAGSTGRKLVYLNLSSLMGKSEPIDELMKIHAYLAGVPGGKYVILLDEVEKMIGNGTAAEKQMLGALLTLMSELGSKDAQFGSLDAIYMATANNLGAILQENPELLRRGRFDELFFINLPTLEDARELMDFYAKKYGNEKMLDEVLSFGDEILLYIDEKWGADKIHNSRFVYSPAEIDTLHKLLAFKRASGRPMDMEQIQNAVDLVIPLVRSARSGLTNMLSQAELFTQI